jgi:hypothetical protein
MEEYVPFLGAPHSCLLLSSFESSKENPSIETVSERKSLIQSSVEAAPVTPSSSDAPLARCAKTIL